MRVFSELRNLYLEKEQNNLVIFVGAGISENYAIINDGKSFPSWQTLIDGLTTKDMQDKQEVDFLKIAQIYQDNNSKEALVYKVKELFPNNYDCHDIHKLIFDLEPEQVLTTNYDNLLEKAMRYKNLDIKYHIVDTDEAIPLSKSKQNLLVKAHGDLLRGNIVLSEQDYNEYDKNFPLILSFIRYVFSKYKVLFIGFSLSDPNFNRILYWVKNILDENSIKHTVILHSDITESERVYFENKSVKVITKNEIVNEILPSKKYDKNYLIEALDFIKKGFPSKKYTTLQRLNVLKNDLNLTQYFNYLMPDMIDAFLDDAYLKFHYYKVAESLEKNKKETRYPWIGNIIQQDSYIGLEDKLNIFTLVKDELYNEQLDFDFKNKYLGDIAKLMLKTNIASIGYMNLTDEQKLILDLFKNIDINNNDLQYLLTYEYKVDGQQEIFNYYDKSFEKDSPYYKQLIFSDEDYFADYILGDNTSAYKKCKASYFSNDIEKYFKYYKLHFLWSDRKVADFKDYDLEIYDMYNTLYKLMDKHNQKLLQSIHKLGFVQNFIDIIWSLEKNYNELLKSNKITIGGWDKKTLYEISFYINYSRFLKFIILNKLPVLKEEIVVRAIDLANRIYLKYFFIEKDNKIELSNWIILGFTLSNDFDNIRENIFKYCENFSKKNVYIEFDHEYIKDLYLENIDKKNSDKSVLNLRGLYYILALSSKKRDNYILILELFWNLINYDIKNIEYFSEAFHMAYKNYTELNKIDIDIKSKLKLILDKYIKYKIDNKDSKEIDDDSFSRFIFSLKNLKLNEKNDEILELLRVETNNLSCQNLSSLIYLFKIMGYDYKDIENGIVKPIEITFKQNNQNCNNEINNFIVILYKEYKINLGIEKIAIYYKNELFNSLPEKGYSTKIDTSIDWLIFLYNKKVINSNFTKEVQKNISEHKDKFIKQLQSIFLVKNNPFGMYLTSYSRNLLVKFLITYNKKEVVIKAFSKIKLDENLEAFIDLFVYLVNDYYIIKRNKKDLLKILKLFKNIANESMFLSVKLLLENHKQIKNKELRNLLLNILENNSKKGIVNE